MPSVERAVPAWAMRWRQELGAIDLGQCEAIRMGEAALVALPGQCRAAVASPGRGPEWFSLAELLRGLRARLAGSHGARTGRLLYPKRGGAHGFEWPKRPRAAFETEFPTPSHAKDVASEASYVLVDDDTMSVGSWSFV